MSQSSSYPVSPPDQRCVWMTAGVVPYQLCDREFECAGCPIDKTMRNIAQQQGRVAAPRTGLATAPLRVGRYYTQEHCWISIESRQSIRVGIEPGLATRCTGMLGLSLPPVNRSIPARVPFAWCRFEQGMIPARLPFPIRITEVNHTAAKDPGIVTRDPFDHGWLCIGEIEPSHMQSSKVMTGWGAEKVYGMDSDNFLSAIRETAGIEADPGVGPTAYDGGELSLDAARFLGTAQYCSLISRIYCKVT